MSKKRSKRKPKKKRQPTPEEAKRARMAKAEKFEAPTANAKIIYDLMLSSNIRGNFKDYVVIAGKRVIDWLGSYDIVKEEDGSTLGIEGIGLIHKSKLNNLIGAELAAYFWKQGIGRKVRKRAK